ncbi:MAG: hypothetical protein KJO23_04940 [Bacteroidia bacterium]|nr:hypothetical protein [Bacteroidia bacterium]NNM22619.1 hypothetical protein [Flavobacteriaceae bacterium]
MDKLKSAGLFGAELVPVSGSLAERYNGCLAMLGLKPTKLKKFHIDGMGWSPEISEEKKQTYYLNIGEANSNAIVLSPAQKDMAVYMPFHSFDKDIMTTIFTAYESEIRDITKDSAICVHLDQDIDAYYEPFDLLRFKQLSVSFKLLNDLESKQQEQLKLVELFEEGNNFIDRGIHNKILETAKQYGDLRERKLRLEPIQLKIRSFYTKAFGGIFVLTDFVTNIIVFESLELFEKAIKDTVHDVSLFHVSHNELTSTLVNHRITDFNIKKTSKSKRYERIKKHLFVEAIENFEHPLHEILDSPFLFKKYLNELDPETRKRLMSVELYNQRKIVERDLKIEQVVDLEFSKSLLEPHSSLEDELRDLVWKLLIKIAPSDPLHLYWYDKEQFYRTYEDWNPSYQEWVINCILDNNKNESP